MPVIAGLAVGVGFVILISSWSAFAPMHAGDYIRIGNSNGLVKSFLQIFPDAYVAAEEHIDNSTGTKWVSLHYTTSEPWNGDNRYEIPVSLRVIMDGRGHPILFNIYCYSEEGADSGRIWELSHAMHFLERSEHCRAATQKLSE